MFVSIYIVRNSYSNEKNRYFEFSFLALQRFTHPPISVHMTLSVGRIYTWLTPKVRLHLPAALRDLDFSLQRSFYEYWTETW